MMTLLLLLACIVLLLLFEDIVAFGGSATCRDDLLGIAKLNHMLLMRL